MPYYFESLTSPIDDDHHWERIQEIWLVIKNDLEWLHFETEEEALSKVYRKSLDPNDMRFDSWNVARFRETDDRDNLLYFYDLARGLLEEVERLIEAEQMDAKFMAAWTQLIACHGFVASAVMARGDDLQSKRAGLRGGQAKSVEAQQRWFSHYFLQIYERRTGRARAEYAVEGLVNDIVRGGQNTPGFEPAWFEKMLDRSGRDNSHCLLTGSFRERKLSIKKMRKLVLLPTDDLPPLDLKLPRP